MKALMANYDIIKENEEMTSFEGKIVFSIFSVGEYELFVNINGLTRKHDSNSPKFLTFPITITD